MPSKRQSSDQLAISLDNSLIGSPGTRSNQSTNEGGGYHLGRATISTDSSTELFVVMILRCDVATNEGGE